MPWPAKQWRAIAAQTMAKKGKKAGRKYLHKLKKEAGGHATIQSSAAKKYDKNKVDGESKKR